MAYIFLTDDAPEAEEFESNYVYFNESNTAAVAEIERLLVKRMKDPSVTNELVELCRKSYEVNSSRLNIFSSLKTRAGLYLKKIRRRFNICKHTTEIAVNSI
jgi:hypothetical protein